MTTIEKISRWLENRWVAPAYGGWVLGGITLCFFAAATNTMAGWLYVLSGLNLALLGLAAFLPSRALRQLKVSRQPIAPVSAGEPLTLELTLENPSPRNQTLLQIKDLLPFVLSAPVETPLEAIPAGSTYRWVYSASTTRRGIYGWQNILLRTGTPLGLFWCCRSREVQAKAVVYPPILPLKSCPLIDTLGQDESTRLQSDRLYLAATEGITKTLRPYRQRDSTRLIHWRTSARLGELQVRELEVITGGREVIICLDTAASWQEEDFEQAVIAAASLYAYSSSHQLNVKLWTATTGLLHGMRVVLEALAATSFEEEKTNKLPALPLVWLTPNPANLDALPPSSSWLLFSPAGANLPVNTRGLIINGEEPLERQLQKPIS